MKRSALLSLLLPLLLLLAPGAPAQNAPAQDEPQTGAQEPYLPGRDVPWVPTPQVLVEKMLDMARLTPHDVVVDLGSGALTRLTSHAANDWFPVWSPDATELLFASDRNETPSFYRTRASGAGQDELVFQAPATQPREAFPTDWSPDGRYAVFHAFPQTRSSGGGIWRATIERLAPELIGEDPVNVERLWAKMWIPKLIGRRGLTTRAISSIDIGLWDIRGKVANLPLYKLLGGFRDAVPTYVAGGYYEEGKGLKELAAEMEENVRLGARAIKMKIGAVPIGRWIQPAEVAELVAYLASPAAAALTGQAIELSGGL